MSVLSLYWEPLNLERWSWNNNGIEPIHRWWHICSSTMLPVVSQYNRDQSRYAPSQWETSVHCNNVSHWLGAYLDWSLPIHAVIPSIIWTSQVFQYAMTYKKQLLPHLGCWCAWLQGPLLSDESGVCVGVGGSRTSAVTWWGDGGEDKLGHHAIKGTTGQQWNKQINPLRSEHHRLHFAGI